MKKRLIHQESQNILDQQACKNCRYRSDDFTSVCVNADSDRVADFVMPDDWCEEWEEKED